MKPEPNQLRVRHVGQCLSIYRQAANGEQLQVATVFPDELPWLVDMLAKIRDASAEARADVARVATVAGVEPSGLFTPEAVASMAARFGREG